MTMWLLVNLSYYLILVLAQASWVLPLPQGNEGYPPNMLV